MLKTNSIRQSAALLALLFGAMGSSVVFANACAADPDDLKSWADVGQYFGCAHKEISEGSSESVARLLVDHWDTLPELTAQIKKAPKLEAFVIDNLNTTLDDGDLDTIEKNAKDKCTWKEQKQLCGKLGKAAHGALDELNEIQD